MWPTTVVTLAVMVTSGATTAGPDEAGVTCIEHFELSPLARLGALEPEPELHAATARATPAIAIPMMVCLMTQMIPGPRLLN